MLSIRTGYARALQALLLGGTTVSHLLHRVISGAIMSVIVVIGVVWTVGALLYLSGLIR